MSKLVDILLRRVFDVNSVAKNESVPEKWQPSRCLNIHNLHFCTVYIRTEVRLLEVKLYFFIEPN